MQTAFTEIGEEKTALTKTGEERKTALTEIGEERRPPSQKQRREDRLHKNRRGEKTDLTEIGDRRGDWLVGEK